MVRSNARFLMAESWRGRCLVVLVASLLVSALYLTSPPIFEAEDYVKLHSLNQEYLVRNVTAGRLPLWNPHVAFGRPFLADIETAALYPPNLLHFLLERHVALAVLLVVHTVLMFAGMFKIGEALGLNVASRWLVAVAFASSGVVFGIFHAGQIPYGEAVCWLPLLLWLALRLQDHFRLRRLVLLSLCLALQLLCGHPQAAWLSWLAIVLFLLGRASWTRIGLRALGSGLVGVGLSLGGAALIAAAQLLPFLELVGQGNRGEPSLAFSAVGSLEWVDWATLALPGWPGTPLSVGADFYLGAALTLAGLAGLTRFSDRNLRGLALMACVAVLFSLGDRTPVFSLLYQVLPGVSSFRFPGRAGVLVSLALLLGAGALLSETRPRRAAAFFGILAGSLMIGGSVWWLVSLPEQSTLPAPWLWVSAAVLSAPVVLLWHFRHRVSPRARDVVLALLLALAVLEIAGAIVIHKPFRHTIASYPGERILAALLAEAGLMEHEAPPPRVMAPFPVIRDNSGMAMGFSNVSGYGSLTLQTVWIYLHESLGLRIPEGVNTANTFPSFEIYAFGPFAHPSAGVAIGFDDRVSRFAVNPEPSPRVWLAFSATSVSDLRAAVASLRAGQPREVATFVGSAPRLPVPPLRTAGDRARITRYRPERVEIDVRTKQKAILILAEAWYPGWTASVNGEPVACRAVNGWMRGIAVPAGRSHVVLTFRSRWLFVGIVLSLVALTLAALALSAGGSRSSE